MIRNYFTTSWRNLTASGFYSALTIAGLTVGLAVGLLILVWVNDERSYDQFHSKADQLYRVNVELESNGSKFTVVVSPPAVGHHALTDVPGIQNMVRINDNNDYAFFRYENTSIKDNSAIFADSSFFKMFDYPLVEGDANNPFPQPQSVVITQSAAKRYFGDADPMGKVLIGDNKDNFTVTGVLRDFPENTWLKCDMIFSIDLERSKWKSNGWRPFEADWGNYAWVTFVQLQPGVSPELIGEQLTRVNVKNQPNIRAAEAGSLHLQGLKDIHLHWQDGSKAALKMIEIFTAVAILILLIAAINYVNLSTARAMIRAKEVSVRKIIGATRKQLFAQFVVQTLLFFMISLVLAIGVIMLFLPVYNSLAGKQMQIDFLSFDLWKVVSISLALTLVASGIYPALLLSSFKPVQALRGKLSLGIGNTLFRKILVVGQFAFSTGLIVATLVIGKQLTFIREMDPGYDRSHVLTLNMNKMSEHSDAVKAALRQNTAVKAVTTATRNIFNIYGATLDVGWDGKSADQSFFVSAIGVDKDYISFFDLQILQGKGFTGSIADSAYYILNETAVRETGIKDPIGKNFRMGRTNGTIIGVVKDFNYSSLKQRINPLVLEYRPVTEKLFIRTTGQDAGAAIAAVEKLWNQYNDGYPFSYDFVDDLYNEQYKSDQKTGVLFRVFSVIAIVLSCMGLLGLATYTAQIRIKEIGIRKALGASIANITAMLSKEFISLVVIAALIAFPVSAYLMHQWLSAFVFHVPLQAWVFCLAGLAAFMIAVVTIGFQSIRAARANPVDNLRNDH